MNISLSTSPSFAGLVNEDLLITDATDVLEGSFSRHVKDVLHARIAEHYGSSPAGEQAVSSALVRIQEYMVHFTLNPKLQKAFIRYVEDKDAYRFAAHLVAYLDHFVILIANFPLLIPVFVHHIFNTGVVMGLCSEIDEKTGWELVSELYQRAGLTVKKEVVRD